MQKIKKEIFFKKNEKKKEEFLIQNPALQGQNRKTNNDIKPQKGENF